MIRILMLIFQVVWKIIWDYFAWMLKYSRHPEKYPLEERFDKAQKLVRFVIGKMGVNYDVPNFDEIYSDERKKVIFCNHQSMFDPLLFIIKAKRPITFISKIEVRKFPFVGRVLRSIDGIFLDRSNIKTQVKTILDATKLVANQKYDLVIFPEGTRTKNPEEGMLPMHAGSFKVPLKAKSDIIVSEIYGSFRVLKFFKYPKKKQLYVQFDVLETFKYDQISSLSSVELMEKTEKVMHENLHNLIEKDKEYTKSIS